MLAQTTVTDKYQTVVPLPTRKLLGVKKGDRLVWRVAAGRPGGKVAIVSIKPKNWADYLSGLGKELWQEDAQDYVNQLRDQWDSNGKI